MPSRLDKMLFAKQQNIQSRRPPKVKCSRKEIYSRVHKIPKIKFEDQRLTSFAGLIIFQPLFSRLAIKNGLGSILLA